MEKEKLRKRAIARLQKLADSKERMNQVECVLEKLFQSNAWKEATSIGVTMSTQFEFPTSSVIQRAFETGKKVAVPKSLPKGEMIFHWVDTDTVFYTTRFGVAEPETEDIARSNELDLLIVPGLAFNRAGYRVGFGGGYYDRESIRNVCTINHLAATILALYHAYVYSFWVDAFCLEWRGSVLYGTTM